MSEEIKKHKCLVITIYHGMGAKQYVEQNPETSIFMNFDEYFWKPDELIVVNSDMKIRVKPDIDFPSNYLKDLWENMGKYDIVFLQQSRIISKMLEENNIFYNSVYPSFESKPEILNNLKLEGENEEIIKLISECWDKQLTELQRFSFLHTNFEILPKHKENNDIFKIVENVRAFHNNFILIEFPVHIKQK